MKNIAKIILLLSIFNAAWVNAQEKLDLKFHEVFRHIYKNEVSSDKYEYLVYRREQIDYRLLNSGQVAHLKAEVKGYRKAGQSQATFDGYGSIQLYNINEWESGFTMWRKTFTYENYGGNHFASASEHALNHRPEDLVETTSYVTLSFYAVEDEQLSIRDKKLNNLFTLNSDDHLNGERFEIKHIEEGENKDLFVIARLKSDQRLAVIKIHPTGNKKFSVTYKRFNYKPGDNRMWLHHIKDEQFYISYKNKGTLKINKFDAKDLTDAEKEYVDPGSSMNIVSNARSQIANVTTEGDIIGCYSQESKTVLFCYNPLSKEIKKQENIDHNKYGQYIEALSFYNGNIALVAFPYDESGNIITCQIRIYDKDFKLLSSSNEKLTKNNNGLEFSHNINPELNLKSRKLLLKGTVSYRKPNKYMVIDF